MYLGPLTHYLIDTPALGRLVSQQLSERQQARFASGDQVMLSWEADGAFVLSDAGGDAGSETSAP